jgi:hypothetical protein
MATREERIQQISKHPDGTIFVVKSQNGLYWKQDDHGYSEDISEARVFSKQDIMSRLASNGLMDKTIESFISKEQI